MYVCILEIYLRKGHHYYRPDNLKLPILLPLLPWCYGIDIWYCTWLFIPDYKPHDPYCHYPTTQIPLRWTFVELGPECSSTKVRAGTDLCSLQANRAHKIWGAQLKGVRWCSRIFQSPNHFTRHSISKSIKSLAVALFIIVPVRGFPSSSTFWACC